MVEVTKVEPLKPDGILKEFFNRNGCIRIRPDEPEKGRHGGVELRLVVGDMAERKQVLGAMKALAIPHGRVYRKQRSRRQWVIPVYTRADIVRFLKVVRPRNHATLVREVQATIKRRTAAEQAVAR
jgi:hypothetical protein